MRTVLLTLARTAAEPRATIPRVRDVLPTLGRTRYGFRAWSALGRGAVGRRASRFAAPAVLVGAVLVAAGCSRPPTLESRWRTADIVVDGADGEWPSARYVFEAQVPVTVAVLNDGSDLYLCAATADRDLQRRILAGGLEVWLDPQGGTDRRVGLRLPALEPGTLTGTLGASGVDEAVFGPDAPAAADGSRRGSAFGDGRRRPGAGGPSPERLAAAFAAWEARAELRLVDAEDDEGDLLPAAAGGPLQLRAHYDRGRLVLEARLPLVLGGDAHYEVAAGRSPSVALRVPVPTAAAARRGPGGGLPGRPGGGLDGGDLEGISGMDGRMRPDDGSRTGVPEPLQQWVRIALSPAP